jgi:hypothetical protein
MIRAFRSILIPSTLALSKTAVCRLAYFIFTLGGLALQTALLQDG